MTLDLRSLTQRAIATIRAPREAMAWVKTLDMDRAARWQSLLLVVVISVILGHLSAAMVVPQGDIFLGPILASPIMACVIQMSLLVVMVFTIFWVGRTMGGQGGFGDTILAVTWLQFVMLCLQIVQTLALVLLPPLASLIGVLGFVLFFWLLTNFIAELHGFRSLAQVFVMVIVSILGIAFGFSIILTMIGVSITGV